MGASESFIDLDGWESAERSFFKNKHGSLAAQRMHVHPARVVRVACKVASGEYYPQRCYRFPLLEPSPREIYASFSDDRLTHHYVAPFIASVCESVHNANGNISHGNRIGHSAQTGAEQIREAIRDATNRYECPYIVKIDIRSFFPSIPRGRAFELFKKYANEYAPGNDKLLALCETLIKHNPTKNCLTLPGPWDKIPKRKILPMDESGKGLPIGNFYSQLIANLYLSVLDEELKKYGTNPRFVDDKCCIVKDRETVGLVLDVAKNCAESLGLKLHPQKVYIQPVYRGVNFCGRTIKGERVYLSNRTIKRAYYSIGNFPKNIDGAIGVCSTVNCYFGLMRHCTEYKKETELVDTILEIFGEWVYFAKRDGHFICRIKDCYKPRKNRQRYFCRLINGMI